LRTFFSAYAGGDELKPVFFFREELQTALSAAQQQNNKQTVLCIAPLIHSWSVVSIFWFLHPHTHPQIKHVNSFLFKLATSRDPYLHFLFYESVIFK